MTAFADRHIGPDAAAHTKMLATLGFDSLDALIDAAVPRRDPRTRGARVRRAAERDRDARASCATIAQQNEVLTSLIGLGYHDTITPPVILRNVLENPAWYTAYTPYQPEISQGRLEALLNFQTMVADLTGMDLANASLLDEGTAAAEAMTMLHRLNPKAGDDVLRRRRLPPADDRGRAHARRAARHRRSSSATRAQIPSEGVFGVLLQYPGSSGALRDDRRDRRPLRTSRARSSRSPPTCSRCTLVVAARRARRRRRRRHVAAVRRAARLRRPARRVPRDARRVQAHAARPARRRVGRRAGPHCVPARAADTRAAHPAREGDEQHLHRAGAARGDRRAVRLVPRARRAARDRRTRARRTRCGSPRACATAASRSCTTRSSTR